MIVHMEKAFNAEIFPRHYKCDICQTLHDGTSHWAFPVHTTFSDIDHVSKSYPIKQKLHNIVKYIM